MTPTEKGSSPAASAAAETAQEPSGSGQGSAGPDASPQVSPSRPAHGKDGGRGASEAPAAPPVTAAGHYFQFSRNFDGNGRRRCGECYLPYDDGQHIEITTLKPYTSYVCPKGGGLGHSSVWTGAHRPELRTVREHLCFCGAEYVEEDREQWQLSWEMQTPLTDGEWMPTSVIRSRHGAHEQRDGLLELIAQGEPIRNVALAELGGGR